MLIIKDIHQTTSVSYLLTRYKIVFFDFPGSY